MPKSTRKPRPVVIVMPENPSLDDCIVPDARYI